MPTCPNGHQSGSDDWCEVCGHRMAGAVPPLPPPPPPAAGYGYPPPGSPPPSGPGGPGGPGGRPHLAAVPNAEPELCPQCRTPREGGAPFCEECRWNFLTNTATSYTPAAPRPQSPAPGMPNPALRFQQPPPGQPTGPGAGPRPGPGGGPGTGPGHDPFEYQSSRPSQMNRPAEPIPPYGQDPSGYRGDPSRPGGPGGPGGFGGDPSRPVPPPPGPTPGGPGGPGGHGGPGAPQAFTQQPAAPAFPQQGPPGPGGPQSGGPSFGGGDDDWVISPPSGGSPGGPGTGQVGGYGYPQPGSTQAPPGPGPAYQQQRQPLSWSATIGPDREYFMAMMQRSGPEAAGLNLPAYSPEQQRPLTGNQMTIGRRRHSTGDTPDIDLSVPPEDPGVSHQHAVLVQQPDGSWAVVDQNSTNGTTVNGGEEPIQPFVPIPLQDGDRVHVGAWTTITIRLG
ncbi:FHA domain-containing protein [Streptomyces sp. NBC_01136]|uniref:FHA domain-containing protein n=1 Tax=unclassified Streptomyces TaxID=2593676 RepID=UPI00324D7FEA|nr:FHA domain-containing protein [Streptomyces sp. NBC_01136]